MVKKQGKRTSWNVELRRTGQDGSKISTDINTYRWFFVFLKMGLELEGTTFTISNKKHTLKFDNKHNWWKLINLNSIRKMPKLIKEDSKGQSSVIKKMFNDNLWKKYRHLFIERGLILGRNEDVPNDYDSYHFPPTFTLREKLSAVRLNAMGKEVKFKAGRNIKGKSRRSNADIILGDSSELLMKRLFHILRLDMSVEKMKSIDLFFKVNKIMNKNFIIPEIVRSNAYAEKGDGYATRGATGTRPSSNVGEFNSNIRTTQRDRRQVKVLLINLSKGIFPKIDKVL